MGYFLTVTAKVFETLIVSVGTHLSVTVAGIFFLGMPVTFASGAYVMVILQKTGMPLTYAVTLSLLFAMVLTYFFAMAYTRMSNDSYAVLTLASIIAMEALLKSWESMTGGTLGISGISRPDLMSSLSTLIIGQLILVLVVVSFEFVILKTAFGRRLKALKESKESLNSLGVSDRQTGALVVGLASMLAALTGIFAIWRIQFLDPSFTGISILLQTLTVAILAHKPKTLYLVVATIVVVLLPEVLRFLHFSSVILGHMRILLYSVFVITMIRTLSPKGAVAKRSY
jgi:branched-chain amino acid transport system permease protein